MRMECKCQRMMVISLRTVIYQNKVEIGNVPVFTCEKCSRSAVMPEVKSDLSKLIKELGSEPVRHQINFNEVSELACLMKMVSDKERRHESVHMILEERINQLLDMLLLARSLGDQPWIDDIISRLCMITQYANDTYELKS